MTLRDLTDVVSKEVNMERREKGKVQLKELVDELAMIKSEYDSIRAQRSALEKGKMRQDLVTFRNPNERQQQPLTEESVHSHESTVIDYSQQKVNDFIAMGQHALDSLRLQGGQFKGFERRALDLARSLGVSDGVIRVIQRRQASDRFIFWACVMVVILFLLWIIFRCLF